MIRSYWYLGLVALAAVLGSLGPYGAPLAVVGLALGIFFGTVSIRRGMRSPTSLNGGSRHPAVYRGDAPHPAVYCGDASHPAAPDATTPPGV
jgi:hypothetical protein